MDLTLKVQTQSGTTMIRLFKDRASPTSYKEFTCTVSCSDGFEHRAEIPAAEIQELLQKIGKARISPLAKCALGPNGISYELDICDEGFARATYRWWMEPGEEWKALSEIVRALIGLVRRVAGRPILSG